MLESSIRDELARAGMPDLGVSVSGEGDVFITGVVLNHDDEDRAIALARGHGEVRDIYFSGGMWHEGDSEEPPSGASGSAADIVSAGPHRATTVPMPAGPMVSPDSPPQN